MRRVTLGIIALIVVLTIGSSSWAGSKDSLEYQLAVINAGGYVKDNDLTIARFRSLLVQMSSKYTNTKQQIGDSSALATQLLEEKGVRVKLMDLMEGLNKVMPRGVENQKYEEYCAMYITMRDLGYGHLESIDSMQALVEVLR